MNRSSIRTPKLWSRFDLVALLIMFALLVILIIFWVIGLGPGNEECESCGDKKPQEENIISAPIEKTITPAPVEPKPVVPEPVAPTLDAYMFVVETSSDGAVASGVVGDDSTKMYFSNLTNAYLSGVNVTNEVEVNDTHTSISSDSINNSSVVELFKMLPEFDTSTLTMTPTTISIEGSVADKATFDSLSQTVENLEESGYSVDNQVTLLAPKIDCAKALRASQVEFAFGSATLTPAGKRTLRGALSCLTSGNYKVVGHTDSVGSEQANLILSQQRADSARAFLIELGVAQSRLISQGKGESDPAATNDTEEGRALNRRIEFIAY